MSAAENVTRELASLLAQLRAADPGFRVFGSAKHRYEVRRTRWAWELVAIEAAHRFVIPDDYRAFLLRVGDGGAGPDYGLVPLGDAVAEVGTGAFRPESLQDDDSAWDGRIEIGDHGCAIYSSLVVRGAMRGGSDPERIEFGTAFLA